MRSNLYNLRVISRSVIFVDGHSRILNHRRDFSVKTQEDLLLSFNHESSRLCPWRSVQQFADSLLENNILHQCDGLIMVNKPYGVGTSTPSLSDRTEDIKVNPSQAGNSEYTLTQAMPHLAKALGYKNLTVVKSPEKFNSGVAILSASDAVTRSVRSSQKRSKPMKQLTESYLAVCVGVPIHKTSANKFGITLKSIEATGRKYPVLLSEWSKRSVDRGEVKPANVNHRILSTATNRLACLLEVQPSTTRWHFIRVYLSHLLCPALGDHLFGSRVADVGGVPILIDPASGKAAMPQKLNYKFLTALSLRSGQENAIPTHIHLHSVKLINYNDGADLIVQAPLPDNFQNSCQKLGLAMAI